MRNGLLPFPQMAQAAGAVRYDPTIGRFVPVDQFVDSRFRVTGSTDPTKRVALEVDTNVPTATTVTLTAPAASGTLPLLESAQTFSGQQTFSQPILVADGTTALPSIARSTGATSGISWNGSTLQVSVSATKAMQVAASTTQWFNFASQTINILNRANGSEASPTKVLSGEVIGTYRFGGYYDNGAGTVGYDNDVAGLRCVAAEDFNGTGNTGAYLAIMTTAVGAASNTVRFRFTQGGQFVGGDQDALATFETVTTPRIQNLGTNDNGSSLGLARFSASAGSAWLIGAHSRGASIGAYTATTTNDDLLRISGQGVDTTATAFREAAAILIEQDAAGGASAVPGRVSIHTATSGGTVTEALRVDSGQGVQIRSSMSTTTPGAGQLAVRGIQGDSQTITTTGNIAALASDTLLGRLTGAAPVIQGIAAPSLGCRIAEYYCVNAVTVNHEDAAASAANRVTSDTGANIAVAAGKTIIFIYDDVSTRWRPVRY